MNIKLNNTIGIDLEKLIVSRLLIQANSGGGKSWLIRRIVEQVYGKVQIIILDPEGEFSTLREKYDFVLAGKGGDTPAEPKSAALLAQRLLELKVSAIVDLYELPSQERKRFVRLFVDSMVNSPKELWHPVIVVIDEAHIFCPEKGESEASSAVIDLATRGRKRKFCAVLATQRISKLAKDAAGECNNKLIGRSALDIDMKRAGDELGFTSREQFFSLRKLKPGEFFGFGPAISDDVEKITVGSVNTSHQSGSAASMKVAPPTEAIKKILGKLADLPKEAEAQIKTIADLKAEIISLKRGQKGFTKEDLEAHLQPHLIGIASERLAVQNLVKDWEEFIESLYKIARNNLSVGIRDLKVPSLREKGFVNPIKPYCKPPKPPIVNQLEPQNEGGNSGPESRILNSIAWMESIGISEPDQVAIAFLSGYKYGGGAFNNPRGSLRQKGMVEYRGDKIALTDRGRSRATIPESSLDNDQLHQKVLSILPGPEKKLLTILLERHPEAVPGPELAELSGYQFGGGAFNNPKGRLRTLGLIEYVSGGMVRARDILFIQ